MNAERIYQLVHQINSNLVDLSSRKARAACSYAPAAATSDAPELLITEKPVQILTTLDRRAADTAPCLDPIVDCSIS